MGPRLPHHIGHHWSSVIADMSFRPSPHWESFIRKEVESGRYASSDEVITEGLRALKERDRRVGALRAHLAIGAAQADRGEFVEYSLAGLLEELDREE